MMETSKRRSDRVLINLPISVAGVGPTGKPFSEDTTTVSVSQHGAGIALRTAVVPGQEITIHRKRSVGSRAAACEVVTQIGTMAGLRVFSVSFREPAAGFWDIYFPPLPPDQETAGRSLLRCEVCGARQVVHLDHASLCRFNIDRRLSLHCDDCQRDTVWRELEQETPAVPAPVPANPLRLASAPPASNRRKHRRLAADVPVCIRRSGASDDVTTTIDISHGGLCFASRRRYQSGEYVQVAVPYSPNALNVFVEARIAHESKVPSQDLYRYGIMYLAENEPAAK